MESAVRRHLMGFFQSLVPSSALTGDLTEDSPLEFTIEGETFIAFSRTRRNGTEILQLAVDVVRIDRTVDTLNYIAEHAADGTFGSLAAVRETSNGDLELQVWHTLIADAVTLAGLEEVGETMSMMAGLHRQNLESLIDSATTSHGASLRSQDEVLDDLNNLVGMSGVKDEVTGILKAVHVANKRAERGLVRGDSSPNLVFAGNPGTGKTTVARIVAELYRSAGVIPSGHLVETNRAGLVAEYIGQTAVKTEEVCESALGGVLFIDEAYSLASGGHKDFGAEAIATLIQFMENHRDEMAVIVAGYPKEMVRFLEANPGLESRFDITVTFPDYSNDELDLIFQKLADQNQYDLTPDARERLRDHIEGLERGHGFGNAREMRKLFQAVVRRQAQNMENPSLARTSMLRRIDANAFPTPRESEPQDPSNRPGYL